MEHTNDSLDHKMGGALPGLPELFFFPTTDLYLRGKYENSNCSLPLFHILGSLEWTFSNRSCHKLITSRSNRSKGLVNLKVS